VCTPHGLHIFLCRFNDDDDRDAARDYLFERSFVLPLKCNKISGNSSYNEVNKIKCKGMLRDENNDDI
jgi:hypothetical protein